MSKLARWSIIGIVVIGAGLEVFAYVAFRGSVHPLSLSIAVAVYALVAALVVWLGDRFAGRSRRAR